MSGDLPIRKARTKREKNISYNDSRMRFRESLKANSNENAPSEEDDKIEEKKMKVGETEAAIEQPTIDDNMSDDNAKAPIMKKDVNEHDDKDDGEKPKEGEDISDTKEDNAAIMNEDVFINSEVDDVEKSAGISNENKNNPTGEISGEIPLEDDHNSGGDGSGINTSAEGPSNEKKPEDEVIDSDALWDEIFFGSEEEGKPIHQKDSQKYFTAEIPTPPAKTTSEEDTDDDEKEDDSDDNDSQNDIDDKEEDKDMDDEGNGGSNASTEDNKDEDGSGAAEGNDKPPDDKDKDQMEHDTPRKEENVNNKDNTDNISVDDDGSNDAISEDFNIEWAVVPYFIDYDDENEYSSSFDYDPHEFLSQDGGSGLEEDNNYYSGEEEHDYIEEVVVVRGAG